VVIHFVFAVLSGGHTLSLHYQIMPHVKQSNVVQVFMFFSFLFMLCCHHHFGCIYHEEPLT